MVACPEFWFTYKKKMFVVYISWIGGTVCVLQNISSLGGRGSIVGSNLRKDKQTIDM